MLSVYLELGGKLRNRDLRLSYFHLLQEFSDSLTEMINHE
jgi:hypothetical protein